MSKAQMAASEFKTALKKIRFDASERTEPMDFTDLKSYFDGYSISVDQADMLWKFLDTNMIMVLHIDEDDPLFACIPEAEPAEEAPVTAASPAAGKQDVSHVAADSSAIARELIRRAYRNSQMECSADALADGNVLPIARKLAAKLRPNEMRALVLSWGIAEDGTLSPEQIKAQTGIPAVDLADIEKRAAAYAPKVGAKNRRSLFDFLFKR